MGVPLWGCPMPMWCSFSSILRLNRPGVDFVGAHPGFAVSACSGGAGRACFGSGLVGDGGGCPVRQGPVWALVVVVVDEFVDLGLQLRNGSRSRLGGEPFRHGLLEAFNFPARGRVVRS